MEEDHFLQNKKTTVTDAGKIKQHTHQAQELPSIQITKAENAPAPKINKTTPEGFDVKSHEYVERPDNYPDELEYERNGNDQGIVIIFNQVDFHYEYYREGSTKDVNNIVFTLGRLGYNINEKYIFSNLTSRQILDKINEIQEEDLSNRNSLILFFLTHGEDEDTLMTKDGVLKTHQIWGTLGHHKDLENKPKLFIFQACKGEHISTPFDKKPPENVHRISFISLSSYPLPKDILLCYSSAEGMKAYRHIEKGSWFIQEVCRNFMMYGRRDDVISLFTRVTKCVSTYTYDDTKQMPVFISTLSRKFYLTKSKDRTNKIAIRALYDQIYAALKDIESRI